MFTRVTDVLNKPLPQPIDHPWLHCLEDYARFTVQDINDPSKTAAEICQARRELLTHAVDMLADVADQKCSTGWQLVSWHDVRRLSHKIFAPASPVLLPSSSEQPVLWNVYHILRFHASGPRTRGKGSMEVRHALLPPT